MKYTEHNMKFLFIIVYINQGNTILVICEIFSPASPKIHQN